MENLHLGSEGLPCRVEKMGDVGNLRMMVLDWLLGRRIRKKVVVELAVEAEGNDYEVLIQMVEETWHLMMGKRLLRPLMM